MKGISFLLAMMIFFECSANEYKLDSLLLPADAAKVQAGKSAVFISPTADKKVLMPAHFWGTVNMAGLHYVPLDTTLVQGLSMAGGVRADGNLEKVFIFRKEGDITKELKFDLSSGGNKDAHEFKLQPGDAIFVQRDTWIQDRAFYTSLASVIVTILSGVLIYRQVQKHP